jgi:hypothetical protein
MQQQQLQKEAELQQQQLQQQQLYQHQLIQPIHTQPHIHQIHYTYSRRTSLDSTALDVCCNHFIILFFNAFTKKEIFRAFPYRFSIISMFFFPLQTNQLTDIICRAVQPSIQSASNTLTRNASLRDTGDYAIPQPHPHHHIVTTTKSTTSLIRCGSCPGSTGVSRRGSSSESSPAGNASVIGGGSDGASVIGQGYYTDTGHYDRMPIPIPIVPAPPHSHISGMHSEDEIEPAYATVFPNPSGNIIHHHSSGSIHQSSGNFHHSSGSIHHSQPQINYQSEDRSIYRRGARRWRKLYRINGHIFQAKRFNRVSF